MLFFNELLRYTSYLETQMQIPKDKLWKATVFEKHVICPCQSLSFTEILLYESLFDFALYSILNYCNQSF